MISYNNKMSEVEEVSLPQKRPREEPDIASCFAEDEAGCEGTDDNWGPSHLGVPKKFQKQFEASKLFLTYPHCSKPKEQLLADAQKEFPVEEAIIAQELHACGHRHLHAYIKSSKRLRFRDHSVLDRIGGKHGNYVTAKGRVADIAKYLSKEDNQPLIKGLPSLASLLKNKTKHVSKEKAIVAELLAAGATLQDVALQYPKTLLEVGPNRIKQVQAVYKAITQEEKQRIIRESYLDVCTDGMNLFTPQFLVNDWVKRMMVQIRLNTLVPRQFKNIWISGKTRCGKSRFIGQLREAFKCYLPPPEKYWSTYDPEAELICYDEEDPFFMGIRRLNGFAGGNLTCPLMAKCQAETLPTRIQPMVVCTQISLSQRIDQYKSSHLDGGSMDPATEEALRDRFLEINIPEGEELIIHWVKKAADPGVELEAQQAKGDKESTFRVNQDPLTLTDLYCHELPLDSTTSYVPWELSENKQAWSPLREE